MNYDLFSQKMKERVRHDSNSCELIRNILNGKPTHSESGSSASFYALGRELEGFFLGVRTLSPDHLDRMAYDLSGQIRELEIYCQNAMDLAAKGKRVPSFCIGTLYKDRAAVITEDVTRNGSLFLSHVDGAAEAILDTPKGRVEVYLDVDARYNPRFDMKEKFFSPSHALIL